MKVRRYLSIPKPILVYFIAIPDFTLFEEEEAKDIVVEKIDMIRRQAELPFTDKLQLIVIELPKFTKSLEEVETEQDKWLFNLKNMGGMTERPAKMDGEFVDVYESLKISGRRVQGKTVHGRLFSVNPTNRTMHRVFVYPELGQAFTLSLLSRRVSPGFILLR